MFLSIINSITYRISTCPPGSPRLADQPRHRNLIMTFKYLVFSLFGNPALTAERSLNFPIELCTVYANRRPCQASLKYRLVINVILSQDTGLFSYFRKKIEFSNGFICLVNILKQKRPVDKPLTFQSAYYDFISFQIF